MDDVLVSIDRVVIEYTKVSFDFFNSYFMKNICDVYGTQVRISKAFHYEIPIKLYDGKYMLISYQKNKEKSLKNTLWIETHPAYLEEFKNIFLSLTRETQEINFVLCDVAFDIPYSLHKVFVASKTGRDMYTFKGTRYFGTRGQSRSNGYCRVYDKNKQLKEVKKVETMGGLTRVEIVYRPQNRIPFKELGNQPPKFNRLYSCSVLANLDAFKPQQRALILVIQNQLMDMKDFTGHHQSVIKEKMASMNVVDFEKIAASQWQGIILKQMRYITPHSIPF